VVSQGVYITTKSLQYKTEKKFDTPILFLLLEQTRKRDHLTILLVGICSIRWLER